MSIDIYGFLGSDIQEQDFESRVVHAFSQLGFSAFLHPEMRLLESNSSGCLYISFTKTPPQLKRVCYAPLLLGFGYGVSKKAKKDARSAGWPPRNVKQYKYEICTRTSAGRSRAAYFAQALTVAILAKESNGYFYINGDNAATAGNLALERVLGELYRATDYEFDSGAYPFEAWPPIASNSSFAWPEPIASTQHHQPEPNRFRKKRFKVSVVEGVGWALVLYFLIVTIVYS